MPPAATNSKKLFLARQDESPESYCRTPGVGVQVHAEL